MNGSLFQNDTIDSVLQHREVGHAKDLSAPLRNVLVTLTYIMKIKSLKMLQF